MSKLHAIIMAGGPGSRFWPASRVKRPKHFLHFGLGKTLLQATVDRVVPVVGIEHTWIVTNALLAPRIGEAVEGFPEQQVLVEPQPRDTAPCVALATAWIEARDPGAAMAFLPSDHLISPDSAFEELLRRASALAADGASIITLGIQPTHAATDYGYIERGDAVDDGAPTAYRVQRFREKPDAATAREFVDSGRFYWNSGVFVWTASALFAAMKAGNQELEAAAHRMLEAARAGDRAKLEQAFTAAPKTSVDYAVMEHAPAVTVLEANLEWSDLGSFEALDSVAPKDEHGNVTALQHGARALLEGAEGCTVYSEGERTIVLLGVRDMVVVAVDDALLVCPMDRIGELKSLVKRLPEAGLAKFSHPNVVGIHDVGTFDAGESSRLHAFGPMGGSDGPGTFIVMELVHGVTLRRWLAAETRSPRAILDIFVQAGEGLSAAHEAGLVHGDFKPDNVIVGTDRRVRILDFGLARASPEPDESGHGLVMGTPAYMAPEQIEGVRVDARADQYAFALTLREALYGVDPRDRKSASRSEDWGPQSTSGGPPMPRHVRAVLVRALAEDPAARFSDMRTLLAWADAAKAAADRAVVRGRGRPRDGRRARIVVALAGSWDLQPRGAARRDLGRFNPGAAQGPVRAERHPRGQRDLGFGRGGPRYPYRGLDQEPGRPPVGRRRGRGNRRRPSQASWCVWSGIFNASGD